MSYSASDIAKVILAQSNPEVGDVITNLKLQKLLYYCQGFYLAINDTPLFKEDIVAWQYGPVVPEIYHEYKSSGAGAILLPQNEKVDVNNKAIELIKEVYEVYGQYSALKLMDMTHNEAPWIETPIGEVISHEALRNYFKPLIKE